MKTISHSQIYIAENYYNNCNAIGFPGQFCKNIIHFHFMCFQIRVLEGAEWLWSNNFLITALKFVLGCSNSGISIQFRVWAWISTFGRSYPCVGLGKHLKVLSISFTSVQFWQLSIHFRNAHNRGGCFLIIECNFYL